jgi:hypothetical protein
MMWCCGPGVTYEAWGMGGVIIGLVIAGVGIVPVLCRQCFFVVNGKP